MGAKMVTPTDMVISTSPAVSINLACKTDADCTGERKTTTGAVYQQAMTTAADKAKTCCMYYEYVKAPSGTNKATGDATILATKQSACHKQ